MPDALRLRTEQGSSGDNDPMMALQLEGAEERVDRAASVAKGLKGQRGLNPGP